MIRCLTSWRQKSDGFRVIAWVGYEYIMLWWKLHVHNKIVVMGETQQTVENYWILWGNRSLYCHIQMTNNVETEVSGNKKKVFFFLFFASWDNGLSCCPVCIQTG